MAEVPHALIGRIYYIKYILKQFRAAVLKIGRLGDACGERRLNNVGMSLS